VSETAKQRIGWSPLSNGCGSRPKRVAEIAGIAKTRPAGQPDHAGPSLWKMCSRRRASARSTDIVFVHVDGSPGSGRRCPARDRFQPAGGKRCRRDAAGWPDLVAERPAERSERAETPGLTRLRPRPSKARGSDGWMAAPGGQPFGEESPGSTETRCRITSGGGDPRESATENKPPARFAGPARVKRWGKSPPRDRQRKRHGKPHREQDQIGAARRATGSGVSASPPGSVARGARQRASQRNGHPSLSGEDRTRLTGRLTRLDSALRVAFTIPCVCDSQAHNRCSV
jgi:hypothetical protein